MPLPHIGPRQPVAPLLTALFLLAALCGCAAMPQSPSSDPVSPAGSLAQPSAQILFCDTPGTDCSPAGSFSVSKLRDLNIVVNWSHLSSGNHSQLLNILHAAGGTYQVIHKGFFIGPDADGAFSVSSALPVAGTWIVERSLTGTWTVEASLDGRVVAKQTVTLRP